MALTNQIGQYMLMLMGGSVAAVVLWFILIKAPQQRVTAMRPWAERRGLSFTPPQIALGAHTVGHEVSVLQGVVQGVPLTLRSANLVNAPRAYHRGNTEIHCRSVAPVAVSFSATFEPGPSQPGPDAILTGDRVFDAFVRTRGDNARAAQAWLALPQLREALRAAIADFTTVVVRYTAGDIAIHLSRHIGSERELDRAIALTVACAHAQLG